MTPSTPAARLLPRGPSGHTPPTTPPHPFTTTESTVTDLLGLVQSYTAACTSAAYHRGLLECIIDDEDGFFAAKIAEAEGTATGCHARLMTAVEHMTRDTVHAVADERLPVCTWQRGVIEARGILPDASRDARVRYTPPQAIAAGAALIACAALADHDTDGSLTPILPAFPSAGVDHNSTAAGAVTEERVKS